MNIQQWLVAANASLTAANIQSAHLDAELLLIFVLKKTREYIIAHSDESLTAVQVKQLSRLLERRLNREPLAYIVGTKEFYGREFTVTPDVLIPRPESEGLIEQFKKHKLKGRVLDVGTGSGCVGLTLKAECPDISMTVGDISQSSLKVARRNAKKLGIKPIRFVQSDLLDHWLSHVKPKKFDVIVANLPYVDESWYVSPETVYEPSTALFSKDSGLSHIKKLITQSKALQSSDGYLLVEADARQHAEIHEYCHKNGYKLVGKDDFVATYKHQASH